MLPHAIGTYYVIIFGALGLGLGPLSNMLIFRTAAEPRSGCALLLGGEEAVLK